MMSKIYRSQLLPKGLQRYLTVALILFALSILLPQGVGFRLPAGLPNLDLPRLAILALLGLFFLKGLSSGRISRGGAPRTLTLLFLLSVWQLISAFTSESSYGALIWAIGNILLFWLFAIVVISLVGHFSQRDQVIKAFFVIGLILSIWSIIEFITQTKIFPSRNIWDTAEFGRFSTSLRRMYGNEGFGLPLMSIGPYALNLSLGASLCTFGGFLILRGNKSVGMQVVNTLLFVFAVIATQSRAAIIAAAVMVIIGVIWARGERKLLNLVIIAVIFVAVLMSLWLNDWLQTGVYSLRFSDFRGSESESGSAAGRIFGLKILLQQIDDWWLFGVGPGALFDADRVYTSLGIFSDPGSLFAFFVESGLPVGLMLTYLVSMSIVEGIYSTDLYIKSATLGLIGFTVTSLISLPPWGWGPALVSAGIIESWSKSLKSNKNLVVEVKNVSLE